jgi:hemerythrin superfamily protein
MTGTDPPPGDLAEIIAEEHRVIAGLLDDLATDRRDRFPLAHRLIDQLAAHTAAEQQVLYPALRDVVPGGIEMTDRGQAEHRAMRGSLVALEQGNPGETEFEEAIATLCAELLAHVPVEENEVLPALREVIGADKMVELGVIYAQVKENIPSGLQGLAADLPGPQFRRW